MRRLCSLVPVLSLSMMPGVATHADEFKVGLNDDVVSVDMTSQLMPGLNGSVGYIYSEPEGHLAQLRLALTHDAGAHHLQFGGKLVHVWAEDHPDGTVLSVGGQYGLDLGSNLSWQSSAYYTPSVLAFGDMDGFYELGSGIQYNLTPQMGFYGGYRYIHFEYEHARSETFDTGFYVGVKARF
ncbi:MAG: YfaZ family protein [Shewanella sp.]|nr:YfaZ family protein [Shewanella sp.]MCF1432015.1 YfaZ family protein [Shewanella sp.]MCF1438484.1 YfaZ family protein [Shewanella sp.]MCF1459465.1 YfaZ family protein [Shewanella sp.]